MGSAWFRDLSGGSQEQPWIALPQGHHSNSQKLALGFIFKSYLLVRVTCMNFLATHSTGLYPVFPGCSLCLPDSRRAAGGCTLSLARLSSFPFAASWPPHTIPGLCPPAGQTLHPFLMYVHCFNDVSSPAAPEGKPAPCAFSRELPVPPFVGSKAWCRFLGGKPSPPLESQTQRRPHSPVALALSMAPGVCPLPWNFFLRPVAISPMVLSHFSVIFC